MLSAPVLFALNWFEPQAPIIIIIILQSVSQPVAHSVSQSDVRHRVLPHTTTLAVLIPPLLLLVS